MWIVVEDRDLGLISRPARPWERVAARVWADRLDRALARGTAPESSCLLAVRAHTLTRPSVRRGLARSLQRVLVEASGPLPHRLWAKVPVRRDTVSDARPVIQSMIDQLLTPGPMSACMVAHVKDLLTDGYGPLYHAGAAADLRVQVLNEIDAPFGPPA